MRRCAGQKLTERNCFRFRHKGRAGAILTEVLLAITILAISMTILGREFNSGVAMGRMSEMNSQCMVLGEQILAQLESFDVNTATEDLEGDFGEAYPHFKYKVTVDATSIEKLYLLHIHIGYDDGVDKYGYDLHTLKPEPPRFSLTRDFGMPDEQALQIQESLPLEGLDLNDFSLADLAGIDINAIMQLLPQLMTLLNSGAFGDAFSPEQLRSLTSSLGGLGIPNLDAVLEMGGLGDLAEELNQERRQTGGQPNPFGRRSGSGEADNMQDLLERFGRGGDEGDGGRRDAQADFASDESDSPPDVVRSLLDQLDQRPDGDDEVDRPRRPGRAGGPARPEIRPGGRPAGAGGGGRGGRR